MIDTAIRIKEQSPLVSVVIPAYNAESFIKETINSVLKQTYRNIEIFVVDDGSTDKTADITETFANQDKRLTLVRQRNQGVAAARNLGISRSRGEFIAPIDADDLWHPRKIEKQLQLFRSSDASVGLIYTWSVQIDSKGVLGKKGVTSTEEGYVYPSLILRNFVGNASTPLIRRTCFSHIGLYDLSFRMQSAQGCEDWDLYLRIAEQYQYRVIPKFLVGYRITPSSMSSNFDAMIRSHNLVLLKNQKKHPEIPIEVFQKSAINFQSYIQTLVEIYTNNVELQQLKQI